MVGPVRDMFGALFFLSIGMLIDYRTLDEYIVATVVVVAVFMVGKMTANTVGSILAGRTPGDSLKVGMTMPQMGEFSLAIGRLSPTDVAGATALGPVLSLSTAFTSVLAPLTSRAASPLSAWINRRAPALLHQIMLSITLGVDVFWSALSLTGQSGELFGNVGRRILVNAGIIGILSAGGTAALYVAPEALGTLIHVPEGVAGLVVVGVVAGLSTPSAIGIWRSLGTLAHLATYTSLNLGARLDDQGRWNTARTMVSYGLATVLLTLLVLLSLPLIIRLFTLGTVSVPVSLLLLVLPALAVGVFSFRVHRVLERAFRDTFISEPGKPAEHWEDVPEETR